MENIRDSAALKTFLLDQIAGVMDGSVSTDRAKSACNICQQIYQQSKLEVMFALASRKLGEDEIKPVKF